MTNLLLRDLDDETKHAIAVAAAEHGRSQSAEACAVLKEHFAPPKENPFIKFYHACQEDGGYDDVVRIIEEARKTTVSREPDVWWLKEDAEEVWAQFSDDVEDWDELAVRFPSEEASVEG